MLTSLKSYAFFITKAFIPLQLNDAGRVRDIGMRKLTALFLGLILVTSCGENEVDSSKLEEQDGLFYIKSTTVPFTGKTTGEIQTTYKDGKIEGPYERYYKKGQLREKGTYKDGKRDGPYVWYHSNGQLKEKGNYKDGVEMSD